MKDNYGPETLCLGLPGILIYPYLNFRYICIVHELRCET
jgi:hypothetical protein